MDRFAELYAIDRREKEEIVSANPDLANDANFWESHSCARFADDEGYCDWCGAPVFGTSAYSDVYGGDLMKMEENNAIY